MKPRLRTLLLTFDSIVVFLFSCFKREVEGIVMVLSILIASFTSFNRRVSSNFICKGFPFLHPLEEVASCVCVWFFLFFFDRV